MNKLITNLLCSFIPDRSKRHSVRKILLEDSFSNHGSGLEKNTFFNKSEWDLYSHLIALSIHQKTFSRYQNFFSDKDIVICGSGPTFNNYKPIKGAIHIGSNRIFMTDKVKFDYMFWQDFKGLVDIQDQFRLYSCEKFIGNFFNYEHFQIPESYFNSLGSAYKYILEPRTNRIPVDIGVEPLYHGGSVIYSAFQFALYTNPRKIYVVGCDAAGANNPLSWHHFDDEQPSDNTTVISALMKGWQNLANFSQLMYPDVQIISINPVGLRGLFEDFDQ